MPYSCRTVSLLNRYRGVIPEDPPPNPNRFALQRLGISPETLDARVNAEVDELLCGFRAERQLDRITSNSSVEMPHIMTKEDCLTLFRATGIPPTMLEVYEWAADLRISRFNFEREDYGDYSFLDAYD